MKRSDYLGAYTTPAEVPVLDGPLPRPLRSLHQIEITSRCNLRCAYCPSPKLGRPKVDMTRAHFERALAWVRHFVRAGTQVELNLAGIGESTMHPDFVDFVRLAREAVGWRVDLVFATNGVGYTEELVAAIVPYKPRVWVSLHRPEKAGLAVRWYEKHGLLGGVSTDPATNGFDWAGQVDWPISQRYTPQCMWLRHGFAMALADGYITACCLDADGSGIIGHLDDVIGTVANRPFKWCRTCHYEIAINGHDQRKEPTP